VRLSFTWLAVPILKRNKPTALTGTEQIIDCLLWKTQDRAPPFESVWNPSSYTMDDTVKMCVFFDCQRHTHSRSVNHSIASSFVGLWSLILCVKANKQLLQLLLWLLSLLANIWRCWTSTIAIDHCSSWERYLSRHNKTHAMLCEARVAWEVNPEGRSELPVQWTMSSIFLFRCETDKSKHILNSMKLCVYYTSGYCSSPFLCLHSIVNCKRCNLVIRIITSSAGKLKAHK